MTKGELLGKLAAVQGTCLLGLLSARVINSLEGLEIAHARLNAGPQWMHEGVQIAFHPDHFGLALGNLEVLCIASMIRDAFEQIRAYAKEHGQLDQIRAEPWFDFARTVRNTLSHDRRIMFGPADRARLPFRWDGVEITLAMEGTALDRQQVFPDDRAYRLFTQMAGFANAL